MATITATTQPTNSPPRVQLTVSGFSGSTVTITRTAADGTTDQIRTANPGSLATSAWYDYELPYMQTVTYAAVSDGGDTATTGTVASMYSLGVTTPWLVHVGIPGLSMPVTVAASGDKTRAVSQGVHQVMGRTNPVIRTDGVRRAPTFDLTLRTTTQAQSRALRALLQTSTTLLLQVQWAGVARSLYHYASIGDVTESDMVNMTSSYVVWTLPCTVTGSPAGLQQAQWTCAGVLATYTSAQQVKQKFATCTDLLINNPRAA